MSVFYNFEMFLIICKQPQSKRCITSGSKVILVQQRMCLFLSVCNINIKQYFMNKNEKKKKKKILNICMIYILLYNPKIKQKKKSLFIPELVFY